MWLKQINLNERKKIFPQTCSGSILDDFLCQLNIQLILHVFYVFPLNQGSFSEG